LFYAILLIALLAIAIFANIAIYKNKNKTLIENQQHLEKYHTWTISKIAATEEHEVFLPIIASARPKIYVGAEYEGGGLTAWAAYNNPNTNNKISIYVPDIIGYAFDYSIDWTIPDRKINNHDIYWIDVKMWTGDPVCKLPNKSYWNYYAWIVQQVIDRYSPDVIEIWNEPDAFWAHMPDSNAKFYGCLGEEGGEVYGLDRVMTD